MKWKSQLAFAKKTISLKREVGAISMSSKYVVEDVLKLLPKNLSTIIEYGPGDGILTRALLEKLSPRGKMLAIESNNDFANELKRIDDKRLRVIRQLVQKVAYHDTLSYCPADLVVSSVPFSFLKPEERRQVISNTYEMLRPGGILIVFHQYSKLMKKPMEETFGNVSAHFELRNIFPCYIMHSRKQ